MDWQKSFSSYTEDSTSISSADSGHGAYHDPSRQKSIMTRLLILAMKSKIIVISSALALFIFGVTMLSISPSNVYKVNGTGDSLTPLEADFLTLNINIPPTDHSDYDPTSLSWDNGRNYGIVIDAGSSGSRIYIYSWLDPTLSSRFSSLESFIKLEKADASGSKFGLKEEPGISTFSSNPQSVGEHLKPLLEFASNTIPLAKQATTPVFLFATAGMRLIDSEPQKEILQQACKFAKSNFKYYIKDCDSHFRVISGELEGIFGWLTVNYLKTKFNENDNDNENKILDKTKKTYGFIDMGGASAQIAFEPTESMAKKHSADVKEVVLRMKNGKEEVKKVFVTTFLGYGANQARDRYINLHASGKSEFVDPCLNSGLEFPSGTTSISGSGDFQQCMAKVSPLMNLEKKCSDDPCLFDGVHAPIEDFRNHKFLGVSELWYITSQAYGLGGVYNYEKLLIASEKLCSTPWSEISNSFQDKKYPNVDSLSRMKLKCFKSAYLLNVLHEGFRIPKTTSQNPALLETVDDLDGFSVSWTMGAALLISSSQIAYPSMSLTHRWTSILFILLVMLLIGFYYFISKVRGSGTVYNDLSRFHDLEKRKLFMDGVRQDDSWAWK